MQYVKLGAVRAFPRVEPTKEQAVKVLIAFEAYRPDWWR